MNGVTENGGCFGCFSRERQRILLIDFRVRSVYIFICFPFSSGAWEVRCARSESACELGNALITSSSVSE